MLTTTVTSKYRVTIPKKIRDMLGIRKGQKVLVTGSGGVVTLQLQGDNAPREQGAKSDS